MMNERILKLVQQAREYAWENETHWSANAEREALFEQKFAELMLKASFDVVINDGRFHDAKGIIRAGKSVAMEHFGVEE